MRIVTTACALALLAALAGARLAEQAAPSGYRLGLPVVTNGFGVATNATETAGTPTPTPTSPATATPTPTNTIPPADPYPVFNTPTPVTYPQWASPTPTLIPRSQVTPYAGQTAPPNVLVRACVTDQGLVSNQHAFVVDVLVTQNISNVDYPLQGWTAQVDLIDRWAAVPVGSSTPTPTPVHRIFGPEPLMTPTFTPSPVPSATSTPTPDPATPTATATNTPTNLPSKTTDSNGHVRITAFVTDNGFRPLPDLRLVVGGIPYGTSSMIYLESSLELADNAIYQCR